MQYEITILCKYLLLLLLPSSLHLICPVSVVSLCLMISSHKIKGYNTAFTTHCLFAFDHCL